MFWKSQSVGDWIAKIAASCEDPEEFSKLAKEAAEQLGPKAIRKSRAFFHGPPKKPAALEGRYEGIGEWMAMCQAAIFELWYCLGQPALKDLRSVAFGIYDWTQANATEVLCRLALDGLETEQTARQIAKAFKNWRYEQIMRVHPHVAALAVKSSDLQNAYDSIVDDFQKDDPVDAFELISSMAHANPDHARGRYQDFLRGLVAGTGLEGRTAYDDGHVVTNDDGALVAKSGPTYPQVEDFHRIRAAVLLFELVPDDGEIHARLDEWAATHPEEGIRQQLTEVLAR